MNSRQLLVIVALLHGNIAFAGEIKGSADLGIWFAQNNLSSAKGSLPKRYTLFNLALRMDANQMAGDVSAHFDGRMLINAGKDRYALGINDRTRQQIDVLAVEAVGVANQTDLWFGRQVLYETGGISVDGLRAIYHASEDTALGVYGGLTNDPRNLTGYIGPTYKKSPFTLHYQTAGVYLSQRGERFRTDAALNAELFKGKLDRFSLFSQASYQIDAVWSLSGLVNLGVAGDRGLRNIQAIVITRPTSRVTNTLSFMRYVSLVYKKSDASAIPVPAALLINNSLIGVIGTDVSTSSYNSVREHVMIRIFDRNYLFGAFQFTRRMFDHENQLKYTAGYRDPKVFNSTFDLKLQTDVISNYRGFGSVFDALLGKEFVEGLFRLEVGGSYYAIERDTFLNGVVVGAPGQTEKENAIRFNAYYFGRNKMSWLLNYALYNEQDSTDLRQKVRTHEVYVSTNIRF